jgi:hypothetical protein
MYVGQISRALAPYVTQLVGVDISPRMVEVYNTRASTQGLEPHEMRAVSSLAELQRQRFDLAVVSHRYDIYLLPSSSNLILIVIPRVLVVSCHVVSCRSSVRWPTIISLRSNKLRATSSNT